MRYLPLVLIILHICLCTHTYARTIQLSDQLFAAINADDSEGSEIIDPNNTIDISSLSELEVASVENDIVVANDDNATTNEDTQVIFDILSNDTEAGSTRDFSSVDLDTSTPGIQNSITTTKGTFNYDGSGNVKFIPVQDFDGTATINYTVNDNFGVTSNVAVITVTMNPINDAPVITGQTPATLSGTEDQDFTILTSNLIISDPDNSSFTVIVQPGTNYTFTGATVHPAPDYNGPLTVNVVVSDGSSTSAPFGVAVNLADDNDGPTIIGQTPNPLAATEDQNFTISVSNLIIFDPNSTVFTLTVLSGTNYTFSGTTITPALNFNGSLTVNVQVSDGTTASAPYGVAVEVAEVNDKPTITGQTPATLSATEDINFNISVSNLTIFDPDHSSFTLMILPGTNYTSSGNTVIPAANYNGPLTVNVNVSDGIDNSDPFGVAVNVAAVNDAPIITGQTPSPISATEDLSFSISLSNLIISDPDNSSFTMTVLSGTNYTFSGTTITPAANYNGPLTVNVKVNDGTLNSAPFGLSVNVIGTNDPPSITGQTPNPIAATEDQNFSISVSNLIISDDNTSFSLIVLPGSNYTFIGTSITPAANYNGPLTVNVKVNDGALDSPTFGVAVSVAAVNDVPVITGQSTLNVNEDNQLSIFLSNLTVTDPDNSYPTGFTFTLLPGSDYTVAGNKITPVANFNGTLSVPVTVSDGVNTSLPFNLQINVIPVNDAPVITGQTPPILSATEDQAFSISIDNVIISDPDNSVFTFIILPGANYTFSGTTITPAANYSGPLTVNVKVSDGTVNSVPYGLQVFVIPVNDAPIITGQNPISVNEDNKIKLQLSNLIVTDPDNTYPTGFTLTVISATNATVSGDTIAPTANYNGAITVSVKVNDGTVDSAPHNITITVNPVNDLPEFTSTPVTVATVGDLYEYIITVTDIDNDPITFPTAPPTAIPTWSTLSLISAGKAKLSGVPTATAAGTFNVTLRAKDPTGAPVEQNFTLSINTRPVVSNFNLTTTEDTNFNFQAQSFKDAFTDANGDELTKIKITIAPKHGLIKLGTTNVTPNDEIAFASISQLTYIPNANYAGRDTLYWNGSDKYQAYSKTDAYISFVINPVNDAPQLTIEVDTLKYEIGKGLIQLTAAFDVIDVDDDSLTIAEVGFRQQNYRPGLDILSFTNTASITGSFDAPSGVLTLSGKARISEYVSFVRGILYKYDNTVAPILETKSIYFTVSDGKSLSNTKDRFVELIYTFQDLDIVNGFTPNGDGFNDVWQVIKPERKDDLKESKTNIYDASGRLVFEGKGFDEKDLWDGSYKGKIVPQGTYFYTIEIVDAKLKSLRKVFKGSVTVLY